MENRQLEREYDKKYYLQNKDRIRKSRIKYYTENKAKIYQKSKQYRINNIEKVRQIRSKNQKEYVKNYPEKIKAHYLARNVIEFDKNKLCEICNVNKAKHLHHPDYNKPLEIVYVCIKCHNELHNSGVKK